MTSSGIRLLSTDLDGTLLGSPEGTRRFGQAWHTLKAGRRPLLVYNTSRTIHDTLGLVEARDLPEPDFVIGSVGTELHDSLYNRAEDFRLQFTEGWDVERVRQVVSSIAGVREQPGDFAHAYKSSWFWLRARREEIERLRELLRAAGLQVHVDYSCRYFLDIVPLRAGKGRALAWLCQRLHIPLANVLVAGDSGNDASMFALAGVKGIAVANALPELLGEVTGLKVFISQAAMADGVLDGLRHFGVLGAAAASEAAGPRAITSIR